MPDAVSHVSATVASWRFLLLFFMDFCWCCVMNMSTAVASWRFLLLSFHEDVFCCCFMKMSAAVSSWTFLLLVSMDFCWCSVMNMSTDVTSWRCLLLLFMKMPAAVAPSGTSLIVSRTISRKLRQRPLSRDPFRHYWLLTRPALIGYKTGHYTPYSSALHHLQYLISGALSSGISIIANG